MRIKALAIVGVGLLGGSVALAARRRGIADHIVGVDKDAHALQRALQEGTLDAAYSNLCEAAPLAELMIFCTPVDRIAAQVLEASAHVRSGTLFSDVGSTKAKLVRELSGKLPAGVEFLGSHPLAGSEKHGPAHASERLFDNRLVILTPTAETTDDALSRLRVFWSDLGASVRAMDAEEHDRALALTSHLPHLLSSALAGILPSDLYDLTATGFRDVTRLAAGQPNLWTAIFRSNAAHLTAALQRMEAQLHTFRQALAKDDQAALESLLRQGKKVRDEL